MAFIVETGAGVAGANSYGVTDAATTLAAARAYSADRGVVLASGNDALLKSYLVLGTDYIESYAPRFVGLPVSPSQALSWPRKLVLIDLSTLLPEDTLPQTLLNALYQLCIDQQSGIVLMPNTDPVNGGFVIREKIDVIETQYSERIGTTREPILRAFDALIAPLLYTSSLTGLKAMRV